MAFEGQITFIYTRNMAKAVAFYEGILGLALVQVQEGGCRIYRLAGGAFLGVCREREGRESNQQGLVICMVAQDVEGWHETLLKSGIRIEVPPTYSPVFRVFHIFFRDPDGHLLEIQRFDDADWSEDWTGDRAVI